MHEDYDDMIIFVRHSEIAKDEHEEICELLRSIASSEEVAGVRYQYVYKMDGNVMTVECTDVF